MSESDAADPALDTISDDSEQTEVERLNALLLGADGVDPELAPIEPASPRASLLLDAIGGPGFVLERGAAAIRGEVSEPARGRLVELLQQCAYKAALLGRGPDWLAPMEMLLVLSPNDLACKVQVAMRFRDVGRLSDVLPIVEPYLSPFLANAPSHWPFLSVVIEAAYSARRYDLIEAAIPNLGEFTGLDVKARAMCKRIAFLQQAGLGPPPAEIISNEARLHAAAYALDEISQTNLLSDADDDLTSHEILRLALIIAGCARRDRWAGAYRRAVRLASKNMTSTLLDFAQGCWRSSLLPDEAFSAFLALTGVDSAGRELGGAPRADFMKAYAEFHDRPSLATARGVWNGTFAHGDFAHLIHMAPTSTDAVNQGQIAREFETLGVPKESDADLWVFMTWRTDADRLLQTLAAYAGDATIVVGVGGDAQPSGFTRASAALLARNIHLLARPIVTWGDQRCMFHNLFAVLAAFRSRTGEDGWMQIVCDRSYPLQSMASLKHWTTSGEIRPTLLGPPAWNMEWSPETVQKLPALYDKAIEEAFERGYPEAFKALATQSPFYGENNDRLNVNVFNFASTPQRITWDPRTSWHGYYVSAFEADVRWMSFARLQEYIDVGTETMSTFVRRLQPATMRWAHSVLCKYDLRTGDPWVYVSRRFADRVMDDPGFDELFSVMNMGFAPEMNYLDTVAASFHLETDFYHHFQILPGEAALDPFLPQTCAGADRGGRAFVRKTDPTGGGELISFFANRILEDHLHQGLHWVVADGAFADDKEEPRPTLDQPLMQCFVGRPMRLRDLLNTWSLDCRFEADRIVGTSDGRTVATWRMEGGGVTVDFIEPAVGTKRYERPAGNAEQFTLAPAELVGAHNGWSVILEFSLSDMNASHQAPVIGLGYGQSILVRPAIWTGSGTSDAAILCAFADPQRSSFPTPTLRVEGGVYSMRQVQGALLALCSIDGLPALMEVCGSAQAGQRTAVHLRLASESHADHWDDGVDSRLDDQLGSADIPGLWRLDVMEGSTLVHLSADNWVRSENGAKLGRWFLRADGLQILGLTSVRMGLANLIRLECGVWRLSGWGWRSMRDAVTFHLEQASEATIAA